MSATSKPRRHAGEFRLQAEWECVQGQWLSEGKEIMLGFKTFATGFVLGSAASLFVARYHVVNTQEGMLVVPRANPVPFKSTYVDVRKWNVTMWREYPDVAQALVKSGHTDVMASGVLNGLLPELEEANPWTNVTQQLTDKAQSTFQAVVPIKFTNSQGQETIVTEQVLPDLNQLTSPTGQQDAPTRTIVQSPLEGSGSAGKTDQKSTAPESQVVAPLSDSNFQIQLGEASSNFVDNIAKELEERAQAQINDVLPPDTIKFQLPKLQPPIPYQDETEEAVLPDIKQILNGLPDPQAFAKVQNGEPAQVLPSLDGLQNQVLQETPLVKGLQENVQEYQLPVEVSPVDPSTLKTDHTWVRSLLRTLIPQPETNVEIEHGATQLPVRTSAPAPLSEVMDSASNWKIPAISPDPPLRVESAF